MLSLLSITDAGYVVYAIMNKEDWQLAFSPEYKTQINTNKKEQNKFFMFKTFVENAIQAGELPAMRKEKSKPEVKNNFERLNISKEFIGAVDFADYWVTYEDLFTFIESPSTLPKSYAHGRDALARIICALIAGKSSFNDKDLLEYLAQAIETAEIELKTSLNIRDNTLKGSCREIIDSFNAVKDTETEK